MGNTIALNNSWRIAITDFFVLLLVYFIPALSHVTPFPLFYLDPMRLILFGSFLVSRNRYNTLLLAVTIPLFSSWVAHHPPFAKSILISIELFINVLLFQLLVTKTKWHAGILIFISTVISKVVYYGCKYIFIQLSWVEPPLKATNLDIQLYVAVGLALLFTIFYKREKPAI